MKGQHPKPWEVQLIGKSDSSAEEREISFQEGFAWAAGENRGRSPMWNPFKPGCAAPQYGEAG